jgi:hypothetical protein
MTITETLLIYAGVPLAAAGVLALLVFGASARRAPRYRPGRPFAFSPVWFLAAPTDSAAKKRSMAEIRPATRKGGARGTW